jgi:hypothetical protein
MRRTLLVIFMALVAVPVVASPCWACSCVSSGSEAENRHAAAQSADLVFTGVVQRERVHDPAPNDGVSGDERIYDRFKVGKTYKGHPGRWVTIYTGTSGDGCRYNFKEGERYTVFAYEHKGEWMTNTCSETKRGRINPERYGFDD